MWRFRPLEPGDPAWRKFRGGDYGSYGKNGWTRAIPAEYKYNYPPKSIADKKWNWRNANVSKAPVIPLMSECMAPAGWPTHFDEKPAYDGDTVRPSDSLGWYMKYFSLNRHRGKAGCVFVDFHAGMVGLKQMWELPWHRDWYYEVGRSQQPVYHPGEWPKWMENFKDYDRYH